MSTEARIHEKTFKLVVLGDSCTISKSQKSLLRDSHDESGLVSPSLSKTKSNSDSDAFPTSASPSNGSQLRSGNSRTSKHFWDDSMPNLSFFYTRHSIKTELLVAFYKLVKDEEFSESDYVPAVFENTVIPFNVGKQDDDGEDDQIFLDCHDSSGNTDVLSLLPDASAVILTYSVVEPLSLKNIERIWKPSIDRYFARSKERFPLVVLLGLRKERRNQKQLEGKAIVTTEMGRDVKNKIRADMFFECATNHKADVLDLFRRVSIELLQQTPPASPVTGNKLFHAISRTIGRKATLDVASQSSNSDSEKEGGGNLSLSSEDAAAKANKKKTFLETFKDFGKPKKNPSSPNDPAASSITKQKKAQQDLIHREMLQQNKDKAKVTVRLRSSSASAKTPPNLSSSAEMPNSYSDSSSRNSLPPEPISQAGATSVTLAKSASPPSTTTPSKSASSAPPLPSQAPPSQQQHQSPRPTATPSNPQAAPPPPPPSSSSPAKSSSSQAATNTAESPAKSPVNPADAAGKRKSGKEYTRPAASVFLDPNEVMLEGLLDKGGQGQVFAGNYRGTPICAKKASNIGPTEYKYFMREVEIISNLHHPNIVLCIGAVEKDNEFYIITERLEGSLKNLLENTTEPLNLKEAVSMAIDIARGMLYLHSQKPKIIHADLKTANVLVDRGKMKLCDFGGAKLLSGQQYSAENTSQNFTIQWAAPEILSAQKKFSEKVDIYSFALILWSLLSRKEPYEGKIPWELIDKVVNENHRPEIPANCPTELSSLIQQCWVSDPDKRPPFEHILKELTTFETSLKSKDRGNNNLGNSAKTQASASPTTTPNSNANTGTSTQTANNSEVRLSDTWEIQFDQLKFDSSDELGEGNFAKVYKGTYKGSQVAIKVLKGTHNLVEFQKELNILTQVRSPYLSYFYGACVAPKFCLVSSLAAQGSLWHLMKREDYKLTWKRVMKFAKQATEGLRCLHEWDPPVIHRDIKSLNLLVDENNVIKIADVGLARLTTFENKESLQNFHGHASLAYLAPELWSSSGTGFTTKSDIYSLGVVFWEMTNRCARGKYSIPYPGVAAVAIMPQVKAGRRPPIDPTMPAVLVTLIQALWGADSEKRPTCREIKIKLEEVETALLSDKSLAQSAAVSNQP